jgi:hypothetical protein
MYNQFRLETQDQARTSLMIGILGYIGLEKGTSASLAEHSERQMMQSWALGKTGRI